MLPKQMQVWVQARRLVVVVRDTRQEDVEKPFDSSTRRVTCPESYITQYTTYTKNKTMQVWVEARRLVVVVMGVKLDTQVTSLLHDR